jgi:hypothetical protein
LGAAAVSEGLAGTLAAGLGAADEGLGAADAGLAAAAAGLAAEAAGLAPEAAGLGADCNGLVAVVGFLMGSGGLGAAAFVAVVEEGLGLGAAVEPRALVAPVGVVALGEPLVGVGVLLLTDKDLGVLGLGGVALVIPTFEAGGCGAFPLLGVGGFVLFAPAFAPTPTPGAFFTPPALLTSFLASTSSFFPSLATAATPTTPAIPVNKLIPL